MPDSHHHSETGGNIQNLCVKINNHNKAGVHRERPHREHAAVIVAAAGRYFIITIFFVWTNVPASI